MQDGALDGEALEPDEEALEVAKIEEETLLRQPSRSYSRSNVRLLRSNGLLTRSREFEQSRPS